MLPDLSRFGIAPPEDNPDDAPDASRSPMLNNFRLPARNAPGTFMRPGANGFQLDPHGPVIHRNPSLTGGPSWTYTNPDGSPYYINVKQAMDAGIKPPHDPTPGHYWSWDRNKQSYFLSPNHGQNGLSGLISNTLMSNNSLLNPVGNFLDTKTGQDLVMNAVLYGPAVVGGIGALRGAGTGAGAAGGGASGLDGAGAGAGGGVGAGYVGTVPPDVGGAGTLGDIYGPAAGGGVGAGYVGTVPPDVGGAGTLGDIYGPAAGGGAAGTGAGFDVGLTDPFVGAGGGKLAALKTFLGNYSKPITAGLGLVSGLGGKTASERGLAGVANAGYDSSATQKFLPPGLRGQNIDPTLAAGLAHIAELLNNPGGLSPEVSDAIRARLAAESSNIEQNYRGIASNQAGAAARSNLPVSIRGALQSALDIAQERAQRGARQDALTESDTLRRQDLEQTYKLLDSILQFTSSGRGQAIQGLSAASHNEQQQQAAMLAFIGSLLSRSGRT